MLAVAKALKRQSLVDRIDLFLSKEALRGNEERAGRLISPIGFHPSQIMGCQRAVFYSFCGVPMESNIPNPKTIRIFHNGDHYHLRMQGYFRDMRMLWGQWKCQKCRKEWTGIADDCPACKAPLRKQLYDEIDFNWKQMSPDVWKIIGSCDGIIAPEPTANGSKYTSLSLLKKEFTSDLSCLELKSMNSRGFTGLHKPKEEHIYQGNCYMGCLGIPQCHFPYENKDNQEIRVFTEKASTDVFEEIVTDVDNFYEHNWKPCVLPDRQNCNPSWCAYQKECYIIKRSAEALKHFRETLLKTRKPDASFKNVLAEETTAVKAPATSAKASAPAATKLGRPDGGVDKKPFLSDAHKANLRARGYKKPV